jgi:ATP synthase F1 delta subunit
MSTDRNAKRYATMYLNAVGLDDAPGALEELATVGALLEKSPDLRSLLLSPLFGDEERRAAFQVVAERMNLSKVAVTFVNFLAERKAADALAEVITKGVSMYQEKKKKITATVITPSVIGVEYEQRLTAALGDITGRDVSIEYRTDPSLLGGMLIQVGSTMFDGSIKGQLRLLKEELVKG